MADRPDPKESSNDDSASPRIFISYARRDAEAATTLSRLCQRQGLETWLDRTDLKQGDDWWSQTEEAIKGCDVFLLLLSESFNSSEWIQREWSSICERQWENPNVCLIAIRLKAIDPPTFLRSRECLDALDSAGLDRCVADIRHISKGSRTDLLSSTNSRQLYRQLAERFRVVLGAIEKADHAPPDSGEAETEK
jgi:hypothetical protein